MNEHDMKVRRAYRLRLEARATRDAKKYREAAGAWRAAGFEGRAVSCEIQAEHYKKLDKTASGT